MPSFDDIDSVVPEKKILKCFYHITPIHGKGNKNIPDNYKGISLQPVISKIYTAILTNRLSNWSNAYNVIGEGQAGFRSSYSTINNLFCLQTIVSKYLRKQGR